MTRTQHRWTVYAVALGIVLGHLAEVVHLASTVHQLCSVHGVMEDVGSHAAHADSRLPDRHGVPEGAASPASKSWQGAGDEGAQPHAHEGCDIALLFPSLASYAKASARSIAPELVLLPDQPAAPTAPTPSRYRLAPKNSPPLFV